MINEKEPAVLQYSIAEAGKAYVRQLLEEQLPEQYVFHNVNHLEIVHSAAISLAKAAKLPQSQSLILELAAIFHSAGLIKSDNEYWKESQAIATEFLKQNEAEQDLISEVNQLIGSLEPDYTPNKLLEELFLDAFNSYLGRKKFMRNSKLLKQEKETIENTIIDENVWNKEQLSKLKSHVFYTEHAEALYGERKNQNLKKIKKNVKELQKRKEADVKNTSISANSGARTMFKTALRNHIDLTSIADQKANIMLSINALIVTIGLPAFATYLSGTSYLIIPASIFLLTSVVTMIIATVSTRPAKMRGTSDITNLLNGKTNLFFFGNFYNISQPDYQEAIKTIVAEREYLDVSFINDLYFLGKVLGDKFRHLRLCYNVFIFGVSLSVLAFIVAFIRASIVN